MRSLEVGWSHIAELCRHGQKARITYLVIDAERLKGQRYIPRSHQALKPTVQDPERENQRTLWSRVP
jgi:hypothetical protein